MIREYAVTAVCFAMGFTRLCRLLLSCSFLASLTIGLQTFDYADGSLFPLNLDTAEFANFVDSAEGGSRCYGLNA